MTQFLQLIERNRVFPTGNALLYISLLSVVFGRVRPIQGLSLIHISQERSIWEVDEMRAALDSMEDPILHLAVHLTLVGALREGEVAGLTPEDIDFDAANGMGTFTVDRSMQRVQKDTLAQVDKSCILRIFPDKLEGSKTSLILKDTKTEASCRTIFMTEMCIRDSLKKERDL